MNDIYSFYQLISKYQIEIPIIQRDYAQGRDNAKAADVRNALVKKMINAVEKEDETLFFDFVYGRVDGNKFIPFDGQQRLTTLFLFHKYVFEKCQSESNCGHKGNCICNGILGRFSYATRQSSREFCDKLVQENIVPSGDRKISENIINQSWFYPDWQKDPTVMGMLTMLDEIHSQMKDKNDFKTFAEKLTSGCNCPITFHFVDMGEHKLSDETYVKMNARGKTLTPFENFKASLEQYLEEKSKTDLLNRWKGNYDEPKQIYTGIDGIWLDLFWKVANQGKEGAKELPDTLIMSFFNRHFMNVWQCYKSKSGKECESFNDIIQKEMPLFPTKDDFVSFDIYSYVMDKCGVEKCLTPIFNICDVLSKTDNKIKNDCQAVWNRSDDSEKWDLFQKNVNNETYKSRAAFYALLKYYEKKQENQETQKPELAQWMRIVWNIIENYVEREESYIPALQLIDSIAEQNFNIAKLGDYNGVANDQVKEEIAKARQIRVGSLRSDKKSWEEIIIEAEKYAFFKGAIRFLFTDDKGNVDWNKFDTKWQNAQKYFESDGVRKEYKDQCVLLRTLISNFKMMDDFTAPYYMNSKENWRDKILLNKNLAAQVDCLLSSNDMCDFEKFDSEIEDAKIHKMQNQLVKTNILINLDGDWYYLEKDKVRLHIYCTKHSNDIYLGDNVHDNETFASLIDKNYIVCRRRIKNTTFFRGEDIEFQYNQYFFTYYSNNTVCLMNENWIGKKLKNQENKDTQENNFYFPVDEKETEQSFLKKLDSLIAQAFPDADKSVCEDCQDKICESTSEQ